MAANQPNVDRSARSITTPLGILRRFPIVQRILPQRLVGWTRRRPRIAAALGLVLCVGLLAVILSSDPSQTAAPQNDVPQWAFDEIEIRPLPENPPPPFRPRLRNGRTRPEDLNRSARNSFRPRRSRSEARVTVHANEGSTPATPHSVPHRHDRPTRPTGQNGAAVWLTGTIEEPADRSPKHRDAQVRANFFSRQ